MKMINITVFNCACLVVMFLRVEALCQTGYLHVNQYGCISKILCLIRHHVIFGTTCQPACPYSTFFHEDTRTCYDKCPNDTITYRSRCENGTFCISRNNQVLYNGSCQTSCPSEAPFTKNGTCVLFCPPDNVLVNNSSCITANECKQNGRFISNNSCVTKCPTEKPFHHLQVCFAECPENNFIGRNRSCLSKQKCITENKGVVFNKTCVNACPNEARYEHAGACYSTCPKSTFLNGSQCISLHSCVLNNMVISDDMCLLSCPDEAPYHKDNRCLSQCPEGTVEYKGECVRDVSCTDLFGLYKVIFNGSCVDACPAEAPMSNKGICVEACPEGTVAMFTQCVSPSSCADMFIYNNTCVNTCPSESPLSVNRECFSVCPERFLRLGSKCVTVSQCVSSKRVMLNETCLLSCPKGYPYIGANSTCYHQCPNGQFQMGRQCIGFNDCVGLKRHVLDNSCVATCPEKVMYIDNHTCVEKCPKDLLTNGYECVRFTDCVVLKRLVFNDTCVATCPDNVKYIDNHTCSEKCPQHLLTSGYQCVTEKGCVAQKRYICNNTCLPSCPPPYPFSSDYRCKPACPEKTFHVLGETTCVSSSECKSMGRSVANRTCTKSCPETMPIPYKGNCYSKCPSGLFLKNSLCVKKYECSLTFGDKCLATCPDNAPYRDYDKCYTTCPSDRLNFNGKQCLYSSDCTSTKKRYIYDNECFEICPNGTYPLEAMSVCIDARIPRVSAMVAVIVLVIFVPLVISCVYIPKKSQKMNVIKLWKEDEVNKLETNMDDNSIVAFDQLETEVQEQIPLYRRLDSRHDNRSNDNCDSGHGLVNEHLEVNYDVPADGGADACSVIVHKHTQEGEDEALLTCHQVTGNKDDDEDDAMLFGDGDA